MPENQEIRLKEHISGLTTLTEEAWLDLQGILYVSDLEEGEYLVKQGGKTVDEIFILKGIIRAFYVSSGGEEVNVAFYPDSWVLPPHYIRTRENVSHMNIQSLTKTFYAGFHAGRFTDLRYKHPCLMRYGNAVVEKELEYKTGREILLLTKTAEEKYLTFREIYPNLENLISQYHIASYLGITPVSLSRIRRNLARK